MMSTSGKYGEFYQGNIQLFEDLTHFNSNGDILMKEEFVYTGNTCSRMLL